MGASVHLHSGVNSHRPSEDLAVLHSIASACAEASSENALIESFTRVIARALYADNLGVLLLDGFSGQLRVHSSYRGILGKGRKSTINPGEGIPGRVASTGVPLNIHDIAAWEGASPQEQGCFSTQTLSVLSVPMKVGERLVGVIHVESSQIGAFVDADERLLVTCAGLVATAVERLRADNSERQRAQEMLAIHRISLDITSLLDQQQVLDLIVRKAAEISNTGASGLFTLQPDGKFKLVATFGVSQEFIQAVKHRGISPADSALSRAIQLRQPYQIADILAEESFEGKTLARRQGIRAILALPMFKGERVIGGLVIWNRQPRSFSSAEEAFLQILAQQSVSAIENAQLYEIERQQRKMAQVLYETGAALSSTLRLDEVLDLLLDQLSRLVPYDAANVSLIEDGWTRVIRCRGYEQVDVKFAEIVSSRSFELASTANLLRMFESHQPWVIPDTRLDPGWIVVDERFPVRSWAGAPVVVDGQVVAFFSLDRIDPDFYQPGHLQPLGVFAGQAGLALNNARLFEETQRRLNETTLLSEVIALTASSADLISALHQVCTRVAEFFDAQQAGFALFDPAGTVAEVIAEYRLPGRSSALGMHIPIQDNPSMAYVLEKRQPLAVYDAQNDPLLAPVHSLMVQREIASILITPLFLDGRVIGTLGVDSLQKRLFSPSDIELVQDIATQVSQALYRLNLFKAAQEQAERMAMLAVLSEKLNQPLSIKQVIESIGAGAVQLSNATLAAIFVREGLRRFDCAWSQGLSPGFVNGFVTLLEMEPGDQILPLSVPFLIPDLQQLPRVDSLSLLAGSEAIKALGLWPLLYEGNVIATIGLYFQSVQDWTVSQKEILVAFTRQAAIALQNARLFHETRWRALQQEALNRMIAVAVEAPDLYSLLGVGLGLVMEALDTQVGGIWVDGHLATQGIPSQVDLSNPQISKEFAESADETIAIDDWWLRSGREYDRWKPLVEACDLRATLIVPVLSRSKRIGILALGARQPRSWNSEEIALLEAVGRQLGGAVERLDLLARTQEQARQVQQIVESVPEGVFLLDEAKRLILANPVAREYLEILVGKMDTGLPIIEVGGLPIEQVLFLPPEKPWLEIVTPGTPARVFELAARPMALEAQDSGWVLVLRDVTAERENLNRLQIQDRLATVGQLAAGIAHDFNNIMAAILVYADLLAMDPGLPHSSRERLSIIQSQIQRATSLIRQILDFSRRAVMEQSQLDLLPFMKELDKLLRRVLPENINISLDCQPGEYLIKADVTRLQQALMNLSLNSRDAMPGGGELHFTIDRFTLKPNNLPPYPDLAIGQWICLRVADTGTGIPEEILPRIFDPFFTTKAVGQGTGLGLAQVYGIIKQHGGSIDVRSNPGSGTTFYLYLPALEAPVEDQPIAPTNGTQRGHGEKVLVVEDDPAAREAIRLLLDNLGYQVRVASNGREALNIYESDQAWTDLVVSDLVMPEMGGVVLFRSLQGRGRGVKFLFITGHPMESQEQELLQAGGVQWLQKPFSAQELAAGVRAMLD